MPDTPASPSASRLATPGWLDGRLVLGLLLVLVSVVVGARVLSSADRSQLVWAADNDLTIGSELGPDDLNPVRIRLFDGTSPYLDATAPAPVGFVLSRGVGRGELLPRAALLNPEQDVDYRSVTVSVEAGHFPPGLAPNSKVDVWVTPKRSVDARQAQAGATPAPAAQQDQAIPLLGAQLVLQQLTVVSGPEGGGGIGSGTSTSVVLRVRPRDVVDLVSAASLGTIDLVLVPRAVEAGNPLVPATGSG